mmetsp:Transcript_93472/g.296565  ORF Transcript_93472/g.296565 Transcript_93472/m.296565 type:complete len:205 (-) Transcript_93472:604-1218(-)
MLAPLRSTTRAQWCWSVKKGSPTMGFPATRHSVVEFCPWCETIMHTCSVWRTCSWGTKGSRRSSPLSRAASGTRSQNSRRRDQSTRQLAEDGASRWPWGSRAAQRRETKSLLRVTRVPKDTYTQGQSPPSSQSASSGASSRRAALPGSLRTRGPTRLIQLSIRAGSPSSHRSKKRLGTVGKIVCGNRLPSENNVKGLEAVGSFL